MIKVSPISGDMLLKLGLGVAAGLAAWWALKKAKKELESALGIPNVSTAATENGVETLDRNVMHRLRELSNGTPDPIPATEWTH